MAECRELRKLKADLVESNAQRYDMAEKLMGRASGQTQRDIMIKAQREEIKKLKKSNCDLQDLVDERNEQLMVFTRAMSAESKELRESNLSLLNDRKMLKEENDKLKAELRNKTDQVVSHVKLINRQTETLVQMEEEIKAKKTRISALARYLTDMTQSRDLLKDDVIRDEAVVRLKKKLAVAEKNIGDLEVHILTMAGIKEADKIVYRAPDTRLSILDRYRKAWEAVMSVLPEAKSMYECVLRLMEEDGKENKV